MLLTDLVEQYCLERAASANYRSSLLRTVRRAQHGGIRTTCQLSVENVCRFLVSVDVGQTTKSNYRRELATLWRYAFSLGLATDGWDRLPRIPPQFAPPEAWSMEAMQKLLNAAELDKTPISTRCELRRCDVIPVWARLGYESGLRFSDIHQLTQRNFRDGCVIRYAAKTSKLCVRELTLETQQSVARLFALSPDGTLFRWFLPRRRAFLLWRKFLDQHALGGSSKWLRRTAATFIEIDKPGMASRWLDHSSERLARTHYIDPTKVVSGIKPPLLPR